MVSCKQEAALYVPASPPCAELWRATVPDSSSNTALVTMSPKALEDSYPTRVAASRIPIDGRGEGQTSPLSERRSSDGYGRKKVWILVYRRRARHKGKRARFQPSSRPPAVDRQEVEAARRLGGGSSPRKAAVTVRRREGHKCTAVDVCCRAVCRRAWITLPSSSLSVNSPAFCVPLKVHGVAWPAFGAGRVVVLI